MNSIEIFTTFFGWCSVINLGIIIFAGAVFSIAHEPFANISSKMLGISNEQAKVTFSV